MLKFLVNSHLHVCLHQNYFEDHDSNRVFLHGSKAYKFYQKEDAKHHNFQLMKYLGYFENLDLSEVGWWYILQGTVQEGSTDLMVYKYRGVPFKPGKSPPMPKQCSGTVRACINSSSRRFHTFYFCYKSWFRATYSILHPIIDRIDWKSSDLIETSDARFVKERGTSPGPEQCRRWCFSSFTKQVHNIITSQGGWNATSWRAQGMQLVNWRHRTNAGRSCSVTQEVDQIPRNLIVPLMQCI